MFHEKNRCQGLRLSIKGHPKVFRQLEGLVYDNAVSSERHLAEAVSGVQGRRPGHEPTDYPAAGDR
jgi:hypothetical protein